TLVCRRRRDTFRGAMNKLLSYLVVPALLTPALLGSLHASHSPSPSRSVRLTAQADSPTHREKPPSKSDLKKYDADRDGMLDEAEQATRKADKEAATELRRKERL